MNLCKRTGWFGLDKGNLFVIAWCKEKRVTTATAALMDNDDVEDAPDDDETEDEEV
jgi:hypothetical protein